MLHLPFMRPQVLLKWIFSCQLVFASPILKWGVKYLSLPSRTHLLPCPLCSSAHGKHRVDGTLFHVVHCEIKQVRIWWGRGKRNAHEELLRDPVRRVRKSRRYCLLQIWNWEWVLNCSTLPDSPHKYLRNGYFLSKDPTGKSRNPQQWPRCESLMIGPWSWVCCLRVWPGFVCKFHQTLYQPLCRKWRSHFPDITHHSDGCPRQ